MRRDFNDAARIQVRVTRFILKIQTAYANLNVSCYMFNQLLEKFHRWLYLVPHKSNIPLRVSAPKRFIWNYLRNAW